MNCGGIIGLNAPGEDYLSGKRMTGVWFENQDAAAAHQREMPRVPAGRYNALVVSVLSDGSTIYPSRFLEPTPRYDTGVFFTSGQDPVKIGLVASYNQPGGNVTGIAILVNVLNAKRLGLLRELVPAATLIAVLLNPENRSAETQSTAIGEAAHVLGQQVHFVHARSEAKFSLQLGHSGPKGSTKVGWEGYDVPLESGNWPLMAASDVPWSPDNQIPRPMTRADMEAVTADFVAAVERAVETGFDMIELHAAHGYLLSSFITPLTNKRTDDYGGSLENRLRFPLEVFGAMRAVWPAGRPMSVRISANDWMGDLGITPDEAVEIGRAFWAAGADLIDVSAGQTWADCQPIYGRMFQTPFADQIRNEGRVTTMAVGNIYEPDHVNSILAAGRADLVALARPHLVDPSWTLRAAAGQDYRRVAVPKPYLGGMAQLARNLQREAELKA